ncbi:MAG: hypothetical protein QM760_19770 [Nibricoccus sp.]
MSAATSSAKNCVYSASVRPKKETERNSRDDADEVAVIGLVVVGAYKGGRSGEVIVSGGLSVAFISWFAPGSLARGVGLTGKFGKIKNPTRMGVGLGGFRAVDVFHLHRTLSSMSASPSPSRRMPCAYDRRFKSDDNGFGLCGAIHVLLVMAAARVSGKRENQRHVFFRYETRC